MYSIYIHYIQNTESRKKKSKKTQSFDCVLYGRTKEEKWELLKVFTQENIDYLAQLWESLSEWLEI